MSHEKPRGDTCSEVMDPHSRVDSSVEDQRGMFMRSVDATSRMPGLVAKRDKHDLAFVVRNGGASML